MNIFQMSQWHLFRQYLSLQHLSISRIYQLLLTRFWPNFKGRFMGPFWTYPNCHNDIWQGNISPCDICPYQEYIRCYWPDFDQTLKVGSWDHLEQIPTVTVTFVKILSKKNCQKNFCQTKISQKEIVAKNSHKKKFLQKKDFTKQNKKNVDKKLSKKNFCIKNFCRKNFSHKYFHWKKSFEQKKCLQKRFAENNFLTKKIVCKKKLPKKISQKNVC